MLPGVLSAMQKAEEGGGGLGYCKPQSFFFK